MRRPFTEPKLEGNMGQTLYVSAVTVLAIGLGLLVIAPLAAEKELHEALRVE